MGAFFSGRVCSSRFSRLNYAPVSVIIPCYRCTETIARAVESVICQTLPPEEILLIEDGSDDGGETFASLSRLQQIHQDKASIKLIPLPENSGPSGARNAGWEVATQPYLAFLDADDSWHPQKLEIQYQWMAAHPKVMLTGHQSAWIRQGNIFPGLPSVIQARAIGRIQLLISNCFPTRSVMLRRSIACRFDPTRRYAEDYLLWLKIVLNGESAWLLGAPLAYSYNADFGGVGLSSELWKMEKGELGVYQQLYLCRLISWLALAGLMLLSLVKFLRRVVVCQLRRLTVRGLSR